MSIRRDRFRVEPLISSSAWGWIVGIGLSIGLYAVTRPAKASSSANAPPTPPPTPEAPPPLPSPPVAGCQPTPPTLDVWGKANGIRVVVTDSNGSMQAIGDQSAAPSVYWKVGEVVLRTQGGAVDELSTKTFCAFAVGDIPLACAIDLDTFGKWAATKWSTYDIVRFTSLTGPPSFGELQAMVSTTMGKSLQEDHTLLVMPAMVYRYYQETPYAAPEVVQAYCQDLATGSVSGLRTLGLQPAGTEPGCVPPGAMHWAAQGPAPVYGGYPATVIQYGKFYRQVYQLDSYTGDWHVVKTHLFNAEFEIAAGSAGYTEPNPPYVADALTANPPYRYVIEWYWTGKGWEAYREAKSWPAAGSGLGTLEAGEWWWLYNCNYVELEGLPTAQPHPADALFPW